MINNILERVSIKKQGIIIFFVTTLLITIFVYMPIFLELFKKVMHREGSSHGFFIPFLSLYFIWLKSSKLKEIKTRFSFLGIIPLLIGSFLYFFEIGGERFYFQSLSFIIILSGLLILFTGKDFFKEVSFPVLFLVFMIPIPGGIYAAAAKIIRQINLSLAIWIMSKTNIPFLYKELCIYLPNSTLTVNISCSGIRYFLSFFVFGIAYAYIFRKKFIDRIFLIGLTIPISIFAGAIRLSIITFCAYYIGPHMAEHKPHIIVSWCVFFIIGMSLIMLDRFIIKRRILKKTG